MSQEARFAASPLAFTWLRVNGEPGGIPVSPGMYVDAAEVVAYLRKYEAESVARALEQLAAENPPPTTTGWVVA